MNTKKVKDWQKAHEFEWGDIGECLAILVVIAFMLVAMYACLNHGPVFVIN